MPIFYAGQLGPCLQCCQTIHTPVAFVAPPTSSADPNKRWTNLAASFAADSRGVVGDNVTNRCNEDKKEFRQAHKMLFWFILVF
jgi:hypothetical protein